MSRFMSKKYDSLDAYVPGEQPTDMKYIKLNTNESPYPPSYSVTSAADREAELLNLYPDPECGELRYRCADSVGVAPECVLPTNGSDEILNFAFMAFGDISHPFAFPDITYGFYSVFANLNGIPYRIIPLQSDFTVNVKDYENLGMNIVIANPNAPTGIALDINSIERIVSTNRDRVVIIDEAYIDFGGETAVPLTKKYDNLLVTRTFSKSYSMAGARLGFGVGCRALIDDLNKIKYSTNPYNINRMTMAAGCAALGDSEYYMSNVKKIIATRTCVKKELTDMGFCVTDSSTNFLFAAHADIPGETLYRELKKRGILVRHFTSERIRDYNRITIGTPEQMKALTEAVKDILKKGL